MNIRRYNPVEDFEVVYQIFESNRPIFSPKELEILRKALKDKDSESLFQFVAEDKRGLIGYISLKRCRDSVFSWELYWFAVHPSFHRQGIGQKLYDALETRAEKLNESQMIVETCACGDQEVAIRFYQKNGFEKCGLIPDYYSKGHPKLTLLKLLHIGNNQ